MTVHNAPHHIAFIVDGNRRWAKGLRLSDCEGHDAGIANVKLVDDACLSAGIKWRSYYLFSRENERRDPAEVHHLLEGFTVFFSTWQKRPGEAVHIVGDLTAPTIPDPLRVAADELLRTSHAVDNGGSNVVFFLNYSGAAVWSKTSSTDCLDHIADIDLVVRTGGDKRLSGFIPPQVAFSELAFPECYWPDFSANRLAEVIDDFGTRERRFGTNGITLDRSDVGGHS